MSKTFHELGYQKQMSKSILISLTVVGFLFTIVFISLYVHERVYNSRRPYVHERVYNSRRPYVHECIDNISTLDTHSFHIELQGALLRDLDYAFEISNKNRGIIGKKHM